MGLIKGIVLGFIAGAIATLTVHEFVSWLFNNPDLWNGWDRVSWSTEPVSNILLPDIAVPKIISAMFWGGLWGSLFGIILGARPQGSTTLQGAILGLFGPAIAGVFLLVPILKGGELFFGGDVSKIVPVIVILMCWGAATAWLYGFFRYGRLP